MRRIVLTSLLAFTELFLPVSGKDQSSSATAVAKPEDEEARVRITQLLKMIPQAADPADVIFSLAARYMQVQDHSAALKWLRRLADYHQGYDPSGEEAFQALESSPEYRKIITGIHREFPAVHRGQLALSIEEKDLIPEGLAYDPSSQRFYMSSLYKRKIVQIGASSKSVDFTSEGQDGLWEVLGMKVNTADQSLWANSANEDDGVSGVFHYSLATGKLIKKYLMEQKGQRHLFNDLVLDTNGNVYLTDSSAGVIYWIARDSDTLTPFSAGPTFVEANGIAISPDDKLLYVAHFNGGISIIDIATRKARPLAHPARVTLAGIDGLYFYKDSLVAVQNGIGTPRVTRFRLSRQHDRVIRAETLEYRNELLSGIPTTGAIVGNAFYFMANTHVNRLKGNKIDAPEKLRPTQILKLTLD